MIKLNCIKNAQIGGAIMTGLRTLYPAIKENFSKLLKVDDTHTIY